MTNETANIVLTAVVGFIYGFATDFSSGFIVGFASAMIIVIGYNLWMKNRRKQT